MEKKVNIGIYIRVSTLEQSKNGHGKDMQMDKIKKFIDYNADKGYFYDEDFVYKDLGISGSKDEDERPGLMRMKEDIKNGKIQAVIVWKLDRLARNTKVLLGLVDFFNQYNIIFISANESIETATASGKFFLTVLGALAEMERTTNADKMTAGKMEAVKKGIFAIGGSPCYGYKKNLETRNVEVFPEEKEVVLEIFDLYVNQSKSISEISKILTSRGVGTSYDTKLGKERKNIRHKGKWSPTQLSQILSNESYTGAMWVNKTMKEEYTIISPETGKEVKKERRIEKPKEEWLLMNVEPIISEKVFLKAQEKLVTNKYKFNNNNKPVINHLFAGLIKCSCGANYKAYREKDKSGEYKVYYRCTHSQSKFGEEKCRNSQVRETALIEGIYDHINQFIKNPKNIIDEYLKENTDKKEEKKYKKEIDENSIKIQDLYKVVEELFDNLTSEKNTSFKSIIQNKIDTNREKIENLEARNKELSELIRSQNDIIESSKEILSFSEKMKGKDINTFSRPDQIKLIHLMVKKIVINTDEIDVFYTFESDDEDEDGGDGGSNNDSPLLEGKTTKKGLTFLDKKLNLTGVINMVALRRIELRFREGESRVLATRR